MLQVAVMMGFTTLLDAHAVSRPEVPDAIKAPSAEAVVLLVHASGAQIYACRESADGSPRWVLEAPEAQLRNETGAVIGRHYAGPTWKHAKSAAMPWRMSTRPMRAQFPGCS